MIHATSSFRDTYLLSGALVVLYVPSCTECLLSARRHSAYIAGVHVEHGDRTALLYHGGRRLKVRLTSHSIGIHHISGSLQSVQKDLLPAAARSDTLGRFCDQSISKTPPFHS